MDPSPPIQSVSSPAEAFAPLMRLVDVSGLIGSVALLFFIGWLMYTVVAAYHLLRYGHQSTISIPAIIVHIVVSLLLALYAVSGLT